MNNTLIVMKKSRSTKTRYPALEKKSPGPQARWQIDYDYLEKLSPSEKEWLNDFTDEQYLSKSKAKLLTQEQLRERWAAYKQNARDVTARDMTVGLNNETHRSGANSLIEDALEAQNAAEMSEEDAAIARIDARKAREKADKALLEGLTRPIGSILLKN